jgi:hypothetical protein
MTFQQIKEFKRGLFLRADIRPKISKILQIRGEEMSNKPT